MGKAPSKQTVPLCTPVTLNLYDLGGSTAMRTMNDILGGLGAGGLFHCGVEIRGREFSFGFANDGFSGVFECDPKKCDGHSYRESIHMGDCTLSDLSLALVVDSLARQWPARGYDILNCNCVHFCEAFCHNLGVGQIPASIKKLTNAVTADKYKL
mmetsp:Transcript_37751/g.66434  ORF Transcript_37751/g.66434 Transcript_37751/m.66434 type:complete len:155 (+) Transcript_37751:66-530(+)